MGNSVNSVGEFSVTKVKYEYIERAIQLGNNVQPKTGGKSFNSWGVNILKKLKRTKRQTRVSYKTLGASGHYFNSFLKVLLPGVEGIENIETISNGLKLSEVKKALEDYKEKKPKYLEMHLVVIGETAPDSIKFQGHVETRGEESVISEPGSNKFGLKIGPYYFEWNKEGLLIPRIFKPVNCICFLNLRSKIELNKENLIKIAAACCHFNKYYEYTPYLGSKKQNDATSHAFVWLLLKESLGYVEYWKPKGAIDKYIKNLINGEDLLHFKGFSFTTETQIAKFFEKHYDENNAGMIEHFELFNGFKKAIEYRKTIRENRDKIRLQFLGA